jgi:hypothetical protein
VGAIAEPVVAVRRKPGRLLVWLGAGLALLGPALYAGQVYLRILTVPWYLPVLGTTAAVLILVALVRARTVTRGVVLVLATLLAAFECFMVFASPFPEYQGPQPGKPFPTFTTMLADGSRFDESMLRGDRDTVVVLFRGRW